MITVDLLSEIFILIVLGIYLKRNNWFNCKNMVYSHTILGYEKDRVKRLHVLLYI